MNSKYQKPDTTQETRDQLDLYEQAINAVAGDDFLERNQLGLGNLEDDEMWQQIASYKSGMYGEAALGGTIDSLLVEETKRELARERWEKLGENDEDRRETLRDDDDWSHPPSKRVFIAEKKEEAWESLGPGRDVGSAEDRRKVKLQNQIEEIEDRTGRLPGWTPPHWRMLLMRLDSSRSRDARLIDNLFDRVNEQQVSGDINTSELLGGGS